MEQLKLSNKETKLNLLNPENILKRGYSITYYKNKRLLDYELVSENDEILTKLFNGFIRSKVKIKSGKKEDIK